MPVKGGCCNVAAVANFAGVYMVEDTLTSYQSIYHAGYRQPGTFMEYRCESLLSGQNSRASVEPGVTSNGAHMLLHAAASFFYVRHIAHSLGTDVGAHHCICRQLLNALAGADLARCALCC